jgi:chorismate dehydratase
MMPGKTLRIGAVSYLNSKPLVEGLGELLPDTRIQLDFPSRLADQLASGRMEVALIPSIEFFRGHDYEIISNACVAAHGPVLSVKLYTRVPWGEIRTLALDEGSRTSATLARILLAERHGVIPQLEPLPLNHRTEDTTADAILLIGDRAILPPPEPFLATWDLGEEWLEWTGLPFVFAMWVANDQAALGAEDLNQVELALCRSRDLGVARLTEIASREAPRLGLSYETTVGYLQKNLQFHLGNAEKCGLKQFYQLASGLGLAPKGVSLRFRNA